MCWPFKRTKEERFFSLEEEISDRRKELLENVYLDDDCAMCLSKILAMHAILCAGCKKPMHKKCLREWELSCSKQSVNFTCPLCRVTLAVLKED